MCIRDRYCTSSGILTSRCVVRISTFRSASARMFSSSSVSYTHLDVYKRQVNGLTVATRNTRDFERFAVPLVNPFLHPKG